MRCPIAIAAGILLVVHGVISAQEKEREKYEFKLRVVEVNKDDSPLAAKLKERYNTSIDYIANAMLLIETGRDTFANLGESVDMFVVAGLELFTEAKDRIAVIDESLRFGQHAERIAQARFNAGLSPKAELLKARYVRQTAEIRLLREKERGKR